MQCCRCRSALQCRTHLMQMIHHKPYPTSCLMCCSQQDGTWSSAAGQLYRSVLHSRWADRLQSKVEQRPGYAAQTERTGDSAEQQQAEGADARPQAVGLREVGLMLNCSHDAAAVMARRWPGLLQLSAAELQSRLVQMKVCLALHCLITKLEPHSPRMDATTTSCSGCAAVCTQDRLPDCDVSELVKQYPRGFLEPPLEAMLARLSAVSSLLRTRLQGADIDAMLSEDPQLLMQDPASIAKG